MLRKFSLFFRRIILLIFIIIEISLGVVLFFATQNQIWILMIIFLIGLIIFNKFYIQNTGIDFLNRFLEIDIFALFFVCADHVVRGQGRVGRQMVGAGPGGHHSAGCVTCSFDAPLD